MLSHMGKHSIFYRNKICLFNAMLSSRVLTHKTGIRIAIAIRQFYVAILLNMYMLDLYYLLAIRPIKFIS